MSANSVNYSDEEIQKALKTIKDICEHSRCEDCVFARNSSTLDECYICELSPDEWLIRDNPNIKRYLM